MAMVWTWRAVVAAGLTMVALPAMGQDTARPVSPSPAVTVPADSQPDDIVVEGYRNRASAPRHVSVDPTQFRLYIADAVYRWAVAARGSDSLIPAA